MNIQNDFHSLFSFYCSDHLKKSTVIISLEIKFHSVHGVYQKKKTRSSLSNSLSLPKRTKDGPINRGKYNVHSKYQFLYRLS